ncbi:MAG: tripartite tricarboxylate transporter substrate binding protein [Xanthobacteraceae bacterium]|jgi:tripartite-type tricarboxylate transporter receptor subunit TctC
MRNPRIAFVCLAISLSALLATPAAAQGDGTKADLAKLKPKDFPTGPIEFTVVYPAGGGMDVTARLLAKHVEKWSGDRIVVNNRTGGAGMVGHAYLATQAKPDGYTVGVIANLMWGDAMLRAQNRWAYTDLEPIGYLNSDALTWVGPTEGPYKGMSVRQILALAKDKPGTIRAATVPGSMWDYILDQVEANTGAKFLRVPFQGGGAGINALAGENVDIAQGFYSEFRGLAEAGKVTPIGVASSERMSFLKDTPTMNEALGGSEYLWNVIRFVVVPKGTPPDRKAYLKAAIEAAMKDPELVAEYVKAGVYFDPKLTDAARMQANLNEYAEREREFYQKTGRLK